jgi:aminoglycoside phosphotransferase family enzyme/predicted kinase
VLPVRATLARIVEALKQKALVQRTGGGTGFSFSRLRPKGDVAASTGGESSGPVSFITICRYGNKPWEVLELGAEEKPFHYDHASLCEPEECRMNAAETPENASKELSRQEELLPFLLNPNSYPHRPRRVQLVQTHSSFVFLVPPFVYKVKKPVNFGFLNFSTLEKRRYFCEREVELNRRLAPGMYLGVVPISSKDGRFTFGDGDEVVEYAVKMRKLSERSFLDQLLKRNAVKREDLDRIAVTLKRFYVEQHPTEEIEAWGRIDRLRISTDENFRQTEGFVGHTLSRPALETIRFYTDEFYARRADLFESRIGERRIRDCHGDLHLEHIHLTSRTLHIYDCLEFNDRLRYVDVASDVAFLAMDLDYKGRPDLARYFVTRIASALDDSGMPRLMDFYKCYRAYVRGKVESLHSVAHGAPELERQISAERARRYFRLALQYSVAGSQPLVAVVMGRIASGKSTLAQALAAELGWPVLSSDRLRKEMAGFPLFERSSEAARSRLYSSEMTRKTYDKLINSALEQVQEGRSVILDATFAQRFHRETLAARFAPRGIAFRFIEAQADDEAVKQRLQEREAQPDEVSDARLEDFEMLTRLYETPTELGGGQLLGVRTTERLGETVTSALKALVRMQLEIG